MKGVSNNYRVDRGTGLEDKGGLKGESSGYSHVFFFLHRSEYKKHFENRNLLAFSVEPLLIYPTHYTGDDGYISDTETSVVWNNEKVKTDWDRAKSQKMKEQQELKNEARNSDVLQSPLDSAARDEL